MDALKIRPTGIRPPSLWAPTEAKPMDAMHPQDEQSGFPPNWHGVISVLRSADNVLVVCAKIQSAGVRGGDGNSWMSTSGMSSFGYLRRNRIISEIAVARSSGPSISGRLSPICGVNRLNLTFLISGRGVQNFKKSSR